MKNEKTDVSVAKSNQRKQSAGFVNAILYWEGFHKYFD